MTKSQKYNRLFEIHEQLESVKELYRERDELLAELSAKKQLNFSSKLFNAVIIDVFEDRQTAFTSAAISRFKVVFNKKEQK